MTPTRWERIADLFDRAADLPPETRTAFLDTEAVGADGSPDLALREEVEQLLAADLPDGYLGASVAPRASPLAPPPEAGPWRLVERVGQGGMGEVWRAERDASTPGGFEQTAAVKLVRPGLGESVAVRFRAERQILAGLNHPAIARLLDGGTASDGRPYLATEFVRGQPITAYADRNRLGVNERLALFQEVCEAVAYAHSRLVVHRDLKPSNVLVATAEEAAFRTAAPPTPSMDSGARVKLLDFGIAKLLDADEVLTQTGRPLLTPAYAAPEQATGETITTATDVYGLGVLLYELLTGARPSPGGNATRPSEAVTTSAPTGGRVPPMPEADTGTLRSTTPERLCKRLRGDLDRIVLMALRTDPGRRYRGAAEMGADIGRHLAGLPVEAQPESRTYRARKFVGRNRVAVGVATVALVAVLMASAVALWQAEGARTAQYRAETQAETASEVADLLGSLLREADPTRSRGAEVTVREVLDRGAERVRADLAERPAVASELLRTIGAAYLNIGLPSEGLAVLKDALAAARSAPEIAPEAIALINHNISAGHLLSGDPDSAEPYIEDALATWRTLPVGAHPDAFRTYSNYGGLLLRRGDLDGAMEALGEGVRQARQTEGAESGLAIMAINLSKLNLDAGRVARADSLYREGLAVAERVLGDDHPLTNPARGGLAQTSLLMGRVDEAERRFQALAADLDARFPEQTTRRGFAQVGLGNVAMEREQWTQADRYYREAIRLFSVELSPRSTEVADVLMSQAEIRLQTDRAPRAKSLAERALGLYTDLNPSAWQRWRAESLLGAALVATGARAEGIRRMTTARDTLAARRGADEGEARRAARRLSPFGT